MRLLHFRLVLLSICVLVGAGCSVSCPPGTHEIAGACVPDCVPETCNGRDDDCNEEVDDGNLCEAAPFASATACMDGRCVTSQCLAGRLDCDGILANGCETESGTQANCSACGDACGWNCERGSCDDPVSVDMAYGHACAVRENGRVYCWGVNSEAQCGQDYEATPVLASPVRVPFNLPARQVAGGVYHTCALGTRGDVYCWGRPPEVSVIPSSYVLDRPNLVLGLPGPAQSIAVGEMKSCAIVSGQVYCWGRNGCGVLGPDTSADGSFDAVRVPGVTGVTDIALGDSHVCAVAAGFVYCWGCGNVGQLGSEVTAPPPSPIMVPGLSGVNKIVAKGNGTCALSNDDVFCWGDNLGGQLGETIVAPWSAAPVRVATVPNVTDIAIGYRMGCYLAEGRIHCWGRDVAFEELPGADWTAVAIAWATCGVRAGQVYCWTSSSGQGSGSLGRGVTTNTSGVEPVLIPED